MRIQKRTAVAVSGLVFGGAAALTVGAAVPAGAATVAAAPPAAVSMSCGRHHRCGGRSFRSNSQRITIVNHNTNISHSSSNQSQGDGLFRNRRNGLFGRCGGGCDGFGGSGGFGGFGGFGDDWGDDDWD